MAKRGRKKQDPAVKQALVNGCFSKVITMVEDGYGIKEAIAKVGIDSKVFYANISKQQKVELQMAKTSNTIYGVGGGGRIFWKNSSKE